MVGFFCRSGTYVALMPCTVCLWVCHGTGLTSDANILINQARLAAQRYYYSYQEPIPVEQLVRSVCDYKQAYTQFGGG